MSAPDEDVARPRTGAVGVVVPARDEQARITACLTSVRRALDALPATIDVAVAVVLDRCRDGTPRRVRELVADWPQAVAVLLPDGCRQGGVGAVRDVGLRTVLDRLAPHPPARTWLLNTDADTTVPPDWARAHVWFADRGAHAVAGLADLTDGDGLTTAALRRYHALVGRGLHGDTHRHVYGANLGVRADAYLAVGGFPADGAGEDHGLWHRLRAAGYTLAQPAGVRVRTSARLHGRAEHGLAALLRDLHDGRPDPDAPERTEPWGCGEHRAGATG